MKATEAIAELINSSKSEIEELKSKIKEACWKDADKIEVGTLSKGARAYFEYNGYEIYNDLEDVGFLGFKSRHYIVIKWSIKYLQELEKQRREIENKKDDEKDDTGGSNFLAGVIIGGIIF